LRGLYGAPIPGELSLRPEWWIAGLAVSIAGALAAATTSLLKAMRLPVLAVAQPQAWREAQHRWLMVQSALALIAFAIAAWLLYAGNSLVAGFALLAALLVGAALILPVILDVVLHAGERATRSPLGIWFWADSRQQLSGLSLAMMALLLALAVNVGVATMVETFSKTFLTWLDGRLAADIYVSAKDNAQANEIKAWLGQQSAVQAILSGGRTEAQIAGAPVEVLGLPDHATYREHWPLLQVRPDGWSKLPEGRTCFISEQLSRRAGLSIGDRVDVPTPAGDWPLAIAGIYADYGNPKGQIAVNADSLFAHFPGVPQTRMALRVEPGKVAGLVTDMSAQFGLDGRNLLDQTALKAESTRIFNRTFAVTTALNAFTLGVAAVALLTSLLTLANSRLPQLAPLWALGVTRRRLAVIELTKAMSVALITTLLALPLGLSVAWCLIAIVNVKAFGWRLPFEMFPLQLLKLVGVALAASLLASLIPVARLARMQPANLVKVFASER
jgi:putative ABC transport system permease protein